MILKVLWSSYLFSLATGQVSGENIKDNMFVVFMREFIPLLYGVMLGDGCLSRTGRAYYISIVGNLNDDVIFWNKIALMISKIVDRKINLIRRERQNTISIGFSNKYLFNHFKDIGFPVGKKGDSLVISDYFMIKDYFDIIKGYFATDGCLVITRNNGIMYPRIEFSSISKNLLNQVLNFLRGIGMNGNLYISHKASGSWKTLYRIQFNGKSNLELFKDKIGFVNHKHRVKYEKWKNGGGEI